MIRQWLALLIIFTVFLTACSPAAPTDVIPAAQSTESPARETAIVKVKVMMLCCYLSDAGFIVAQEEGYFAEQGIEIEMIRFSSSAEALAALLTGQVDLIGGGLDPGIFNSIVRGEMLKVVSDKGQASEDCDYISLLARTADLEKLNAGDSDTFRKAKIAASGNQTGSYYAEFALQTLGYSFDTVQVVEVPAPNRVEALLSGAVDLSLVAEPWITRGLDSGELSLFKPAREVLPGVQLVVWIFGKNLLIDKPDVAQRFIDGYTKGVLQVNEGKTARNIELIAKGTQLEPELVERACWPKSSPDGQINFRSVELYQEWLLSKGWLDAKVEPAQYWDGSFVEKALQKIKGAHE
jgi:NitT/TauT family transport system substrate-binding protein